MKKIFIVLILFLFSRQFFGQDILGAYIQADLVPNTDTSTPVYDYSITLTLLTDASKNISRPTATVDFGDISTGTLTLTTTKTQNGISTKKYTGRHIYVGPSGILNYEIAYLDTFRVSGIKNITNSNTQKIFASYKIYANQLSWNNIPAKISNFPPVLGLSGNQVMYNPTVSDSDGDSLSFKLVNSYGSNYYIPNNAVLNAETGVLSFSKDSIGLYAFCLKLYEWKKDINGVYKFAGITQMDFVMNINATVGISENITFNEEIKVFPNPANNTLFIEAGYNVNIERLSITNALGQIVFSLVNPESKQESDSYRIDVSFLPKGIYFLRVRDAEAQKVFKVIKE
jgi:hypothetical protein